MVFYSLCRRYIHVFYQLISFVMVYSFYFGCRPEPVKDEESLGKVEIQPYRTANLEEVIKTVEQQAPRPETEISSNTHDEL
jgi:hypothetical protein